MAYSSQSSVSPSARSVVVSGIGMVSPMGLDFEENHDGFRAGRSAFREVTLFDVSRQRVQTAGQVDLPARSHGMSRAHWQRMDRGTQMAWHAAHEALGQARIRGGEFPVMVGTSAGAMSIGEDYFKHAHQTHISERAQRWRVERYQVSRQLTAMMRELQINGPLRIISNACASGANAIGQGFQAVRSGRCDRVLVGGYDALSHLVFAGFDALQALSPSGIPRPFDAQRDGLTLGEGAAFMMIESEASARARGARVFAKISGYGAATDIHHLTQPHPEGDVALATMNAASVMAGITPAQIDYLNSHGTGTPLNDNAEAKAIQRWAGSAVGSLPVSSTKSAIGHLLGGAGAVEAGVSIMALLGQWLPANLNVREVDPICTFDLVRAPRDAQVKRVLTNSFGFGGANASLIFTHPDLP